MNQVVHGSDFLDRGWFNKVLSYNPTAFWPLWEAVGDNVAACLANPAQNGVHSGVTLGQTGIGDGRTSALYDGANGYTNIYSTAFRDAFSGAAGTLLFPFRVSAGGVWTDGSWRAVVMLAADGNNRIRVAKKNTNNEFQFFYEANNVTQQVTASVSSIDWLFGGITWDKAADEVKAFLGGSQEGLTQNGLGVWAGQLSNTTTVIGAVDTTPALPWSGYIYGVAHWDSALPQSVIEQLSLVP